MRGLHNRIAQLMNLKFRSGMRSFSMRDWQLSTPPDFEDARCGLSERWVLNDQHSVSFYCTSLADADTDCQGEMSWQSYQYNQARIPKIYPEQKVAYNRVFTFARIKKDLIACFKLCSC